jgi:sporulation protein YlmC with PRC-barrel domain
MGRATTLKYLAGLPASSPRSTGESAGTGELAIPGKQDKPGRLDITGGKGFPPEEYAVVPVRRGELKSVGSQALQNPVQNLKGERVGHIDNLLLDTKTGRIEYAVIEPEGTYYLKPVPYAAIQLKERHGEIVPIIDTTQYDLTPFLSTKDTKDLSPAVTDIVKQMQTLREREPRKAGQRAGLGVQEPPMGGPMGEAEAGGAGLSGPRALPPDKKAPGFEEEKKKGD